MEDRTQQDEETLVNTIEWIGGSDDSLTWVMTDEVAEFFNALPPEMRERRE